MCKSTFLLFVALCLPLCADGEPLPLTLERAIDRALYANRAIGNAEDTWDRSQLNVDIECLDLSLKVAPNGQIGFWDGAGNRSKDDNKAKDGLLYGAGLKVEKKFASGVKVELNPNFTRLVKYRYESNAAARVIIPFLRGAGSLTTLSPLQTARFDERTKHRDFYLRQVSVVLDVVRAYYNAVKELECMQLAEESYNRFLKLKQTADARRRAGLIDDVNVYRTQLELRKDEEVFLKAKETYFKAHDRLLDLLALPIDTPVQLDRGLVYEEVGMGQEEVVAEALSNRVEVEQSYDALQNALRLARVAHRELLPQLDLAVNYSICGRGQDLIHSCIRDRTADFKVGFTASTDKDIGKNRVKYKKSLIDIEVQERKIEEVRSNIVVEANRVYRSLKRTLLSIDIQEEQVKTARCELKAAALRFDRGITDNNFDVVDAERKLHNAQKALLTAVVEHIIGEYELLQVMGLLVEKPQFCVREL
ncbi:MAG: TolC family protein [Parachlamydiales bacterium]